MQLYINDYVHEQSLEKHWLNSVFAFIGKGSRSQNDNVFFQTLFALEVKNTSLQISPRLSHRLSTAFKHSFENQMKAVKWRLFESLLDCKEIKPVNPKRNQPLIFIGRTDAKDEAPIFWPPDMKNWKDPDAGKDWRQEEKGMTEDEMVGWHHRLKGQGFEQTPRVGDGQGSLACYSLWGHKESDTLNWIFIKFCLQFQWLLRQPTV